MRLSVVIDGPVASGKSLFLSRMRDWLERELKEERFFKVTDVQLLEEQSPANSPRAERLIATIELKP